jgi:hypothetical protein
VDVATFCKQFPTFAQANQDFIQAKLNEAATYMGVGRNWRWGSFSNPGQPLTKADIGQGNLAAHYLISDPAGTEFRLSPDSDGRSIYLDKYEELAKVVGMGPVVSGVRCR